ncbi:DUF3737 family protein [Shewanella sp. GD03713]|uniref:DUF3737 family protein n=1 Tax=Shewanella sp. GD03713 TaxID=2975372 RepID=UPI000B349A5F|nr:DUF3737 family protein [Shewanella sp. GD03713]MDH1470367.1 DUF3737 family protein [Shewanella sp. GD03713]QXN23146.1 DUF3737 family protein [Shewanella putrefaciens]VEE64231.1 Protein of uncharacterised function (DUF3737) [Shewanella putrefaciens]
MNVIKDTFFEGERPCFAVHDTRFERVKIYPGEAVGESAMKHAHNIEAFQCEFFGKYPFWHNENLVIDHCLFPIAGRTAIWYSKNVKVLNTQVDAPKMFRECDNIYVENVRFADAQETGWNCRDIELRNVDVKNGDYFFVNARNVTVDNLTLEGNYSFQDAQNVVLRNSHLTSKDAFWGAENVTVYDSVIDGEFMGWHSKNLRLVNCTIRGTQALCYCQNLVMENCIMEGTDLCFEYSTVNADIVSDIISVKNPTGGRIHAKAIGEIVIDAHCVNPGACDITVSS